MSNHYRRKGFTIVELAIVIVVIAILTTLTTLGYSAIRERSREAAITTEMTRAAQELTAYSLAHQNRYPASLSAVGVSSSDGVTLSYTRDGDQKGYQLIGSQGDTSYILRDGDASPQKQ